MEAIKWFIILSLGASSLTNCFSVSSPVFEKSQKNHMAVLIALIAMETGQRVTEEQLNTMLEEATSKIHKVKKRKKKPRMVIKVTYASGSESIHALGIGAIEDIREIERPFAYYEEKVDIYNITHGWIKGNDKNHFFNMPLLSLIPFAFMGEHAIIISSLALVIFAVFRFFSVKPTGIITPVEISIFEGSTRNHQVVNQALIAMEEGGHVNISQMQDMLEDVLVTIYPEGTIEINHESGSQTLSTLDGRTMDRIFGGNKPVSIYYEKSGKHTIVHAKMK